ncbi:hypothetical protein MJD09_19175 [bacterium]|nr:hypothetical protein [bacterium]
MAVMSIRLDDNQRKALKAIASLEGKSISGVVSELIDNYIQKNKKKVFELAEKEHLKEVMKLSEDSFMDWDNAEDEIYNDL